MSVPPSLQIGSLLYEFDPSVLGMVARGPSRPASSPVGAAAPVNLQQRQQHEMDCSDSLSRPSVTPSKDHPQSTSTKPTGANNSATVSPQSYSSRDLRPTSFHSRGGSSSTSESGGHHSLTHSPNSVFATVDASEQHPSILLLAPPSPPTTQVVTPDVLTRSRMLDQALEEAHQARLSAGFAFMPVQSRGAPVVQQVTTAVVQPKPSALEQVTRGVANLLSSSRSSSAAPARTIATAVSTTQQQQQPAAPKLTPYYTGVAAYTPFQPRRSSQARFINAVPVRRCPPLLDQIDPFPFLPPVMVRTIRSLAVGEPVMLLVDDATGLPKELQCRCNSKGCQYHIVCYCEDKDCKWPSSVHDGQLPHFAHRAPVDTEDHMHRNH